jgi:DNA helicase-2/ATP-dependent DNA helicase PcrA
MDHLIVDEYQDLNPVDLAFVDGLIDTGVRTFVAGDDDQSIYSFRYASPQGIQSFKNRYPDASHHELTDCFRCTPAVLQAAQGLMSRFSSPNRIGKGTRSLYVSSDPPVGGIVHRWRLPSHRQEAEAIARSCSKLTDRGIPATSIMILISNRKIQLACLEEELYARDVQYESPQADPYVDSRDGRFVHALLRVVCDPEDYVAHRLILGLRPYVGPATCNQVAEAVEISSLNFRDVFYHPLPSAVFRGRALSALNRAREICGTVSGWSSDDTICDRHNGISNILRDAFGDEQVNSWAAKTADLPQGMTLEELRDYLWADTEHRRESLLESTYERLGLDVPDLLHAERIPIMTMHGAKGLDADVVFIPGLEENILPGRKRQPYPGLVNEAARLLHVSITRARAACILSFAETRVVYGGFSYQAPSRFTRTLSGQFNGRDNNGLTDAEVEAIVEAFNQL